MNIQDWTGSAAQRRPQGVCLPPKQPGVVECEWVPAGTPVVIRKNNGHGRWIQHTTRIDLQILSTVKRTEKSVIFAHGDWVVAVARKFVRPTFHPRGEAVDGNGEAR